VRKVDLLGNGQSRNLHVGMAKTNHANHANHVLRVIDANGRDVLNFFLSARTRANGIILHAFARIGMPSSLTIPNKST
jgi:hypothetical protein